MRKLLNKPWFVAVLALSAVVLCAWSLLDHPAGGRTRSRPAGTGVAIEALPRGSHDDSGDGATAGDEARRPIRAVLASLVFPKEIPDPFRRREATLVKGEVVPVAGPALPDESETIRLSAIWSQDQINLALINGRIVHAGDVVGRLTIEKVEGGGVWVSHWKGRTFVPVGSDFTLVTPAVAPATPPLAFHEN